MASDDNPPVHNPVREMAAQIYIAMIGDAVTFANNAATVSANPDSLAKISFKLAEAFAKVEAEIRAGTKPQYAAFDLDKVDFSGVTK